MFKTTLPDGREIVYGDAIHHTTITRFSFWDRIRILFGKKVHISSDIYVGEPVVSVKGSRADTFVEPFIQRKSRGKTEVHYGEYINPDDYESVGVPNSGDMPKIAQANLTRDEILEILHI